MFSKMIVCLQNASLPDKEELKQRFDVALVKKNGVLSQPYHFWSQDQKINPLTKHLVWAAILLENEEAFATVEALAIHEFIESNRGKGGNVPVPTHDQTSQLMQTFIDEFLHVSHDPSFAVLLKNKLNKVSKKY